MDKLTKEDIISQLQEEQFKIFFIQEKKKLSIRSLNVLNRQLNIDNDSDFLYEILINGINYKNIKNAGFKTQLELNDFFQIIKESLFGKNFNIEKVKSHYYINKYAELNEVSKLNFKNLINILKNNLSVRSQNILNKLINSSNEIMCLLTLMADKNIEFVAIKNSGKKTSYELKSFFLSLKKFYSEDNNGFDIFFITEKLKFLYGFTPDVIYDGNENVSQNPFDYFKQIVLNHNEIKVSEREVFLYLVYDNLGLDEIAQKMELTYERVRQISSNSLPKKIHKIYRSLIKEFNLKETILSNLPKAYFQFTNESFKKYLDETFFRSLGVKFYVLFIANHLEKEGYYLISPKTQISKACKNNLFKYSTYQSRRYSKYYWLIKSSLVKKNDLVKILTKVNTISNSKNENDFLLDWKSFNLIDEYNISFFNVFLAKEYNLYSNNLGISIYRNTIIRMEEYVELALEELNKMSSIDVLMSKLNELFPNKHKGFNVGSVRNIITRHKDIFIFERMQISLYGLKIWEHQKGIKGGTIKDIVLDFLIEKKRPCHITEIAEHVLKFRKNSNVHSILSNLQLGTKDRYKFYKGNMIGLSDQYKSETILEEISVDQIIHDIFDYE